MPSRYDQPVNPSAPNNSHAFALELVGWNRRVLELGAAAGHVTRALVAQRCRVTSIEYEEDAARDLEGVAEKVIVGDLNDPVVFAGLAPDFDVVLAGDVLEHLVRPTDVLCRAARLLRPGGQAVISLPHVGHADVRLSLMQGKWDYRPLGLLDDTHTRFFTLEGIRKLLTHSGLVLTELRRVRVPAFETELGVDRDSVPTDLVDVILSDPEAETYQFVFSATADNGDYRLRHAAERASALESEVQRLTVSRDAFRAAAESQQQEFDSRTSQLYAKHDQVMELLEMIEELNATLARQASELSRIQGSVLWRFLTRARTMVLTLLGGEHSRVVRLVQRTLRALGAKSAG